jgi:bifunctional enzyme CysN/CysC
LLADTGSLPEGKLERVQETCRRHAKPFEYAFLLDALKDERAQGITIDAARCFFKTAKRNYIIIDAPGHVEFLKNMVTGAARAEAALLVIDACEGIRENSRRHGYLLGMLGIRQITVLVNKMDLVDYQAAAFQEIVAEYQLFLKEIGIPNARFIPVSGFCGDNIATASARMPWYQGGTVLAELDRFAAEPVLDQKPLRMPVQGVYKFSDNGDQRRIIAGTVDSGQLAAGDEVVFYPSGKRSKIKTLETFPPTDTGPQYFTAGQAIGFTLNEQIYVRRGELAALAAQTRPQVASRIRCNLFWLGKKSLVPDQEYYLKLGSAKVKMRVETITRVLNAATLDTTVQTAVARHEVAECLLQLEKAIAFDLTQENFATSRFVIVADYEIAGGGIITEALEDQQAAIREGVIKRNCKWEKSNMSANNLTWQDGQTTYADRCRLLGQKGLVIWLTGLSAAGKSTIAMAMEQELLKQGRAVYRLDGDNLRHGLNSGLSFSEADRNENVRRTAEVAALFRDAGLIVLVALISPYRKMREFARERAGEDAFVEVYVKADLETCRERDPKGLYQKAYNGELANFTGVSDPYEEPIQPEVVLDTTQLSVQEATDMVMESIMERIR